MVNEKRCRARHLKKISKDHFFVCNFLGWGFLRMQFCDKMEMSNGGKNGTSNIGCKKQ